MILSIDVFTLAAQVKMAYGAKLAGAGPPPAPMTSRGSAITIYPDKRKLLPLLAAATLLLAVGVYVAVADTGSGLVAVILTHAGYGVAVSFGIGAIYVARRLLAREPTLVVDADGILDRSGPLGVGLIRRGIGAHS